MTSGAKPPLFFGAFGEDWCVRAAQLGPPDRIAGNVLHWLIIPGPPMSCHLTHCIPLLDASEQTFYHQHPETWSIHTIVAGRGRYFIEGTSHEIFPGMVVYQGPGVRHAVVQYPNEPLTMLVVQYPASGYAKESWKVCPEAGTTEKFGDLAAYAERFGDNTGDALSKKVLEEVEQVSERWRHFVRGAERADR
jgi:mannose-6-phosphate isomerase-like protein (cupin superfamily)